MSDPDKEESQKPNQVDPPRPPSADEGPAAPVATPEPPEEAPAEEAPASRWTGWVFVLVLLLFLTGYGRLCSSFNSESEDSTVVLRKNVGTLDVGFEARGKITSIDPVKGEMVLRVALKPVGNWADSFGNPADDYTLNVIGGAGKATVVLKKGEVVGPIDVVLALGGSCSRYPHDLHQADMDFVISWADEDGTWFNAPTTFEMNCSAPGYGVTCLEQSSPSGSHVLAGFTVVRSHSSIIFATFLMCMMGFLGLGAMVVGLQVRFGRNPELSQCSWMTSLMFALLPLRNAMPNSPPIGSLSDYMSFYWAEGLVAISLLSTLLALIFAKREP